MKFCKANLDTILRENTNKNKEKIIQIKVY